MMYHWYILYLVPNTMQMLSVTEIRNLDTEEARTMVKALGYTTLNKRGNHIKKSVSSSGSKFSIQKRLVTWFHIRYMQDQVKVNGMHPISLSHHKWSSAKTARLVEIMIDTSHACCNQGLLYSTNLPSEERLMGLQVGPSRFVGKRVDWWQNNILMHFNRMGRCAWNRQTWFKLRHIMSRTCTVSMKEKVTISKMAGTKLGDEVSLTPKCYAETAGGIWIYVCLYQKCHQLRKNREEQWISWEVLDHVYQRKWYWFLWCENFQGKLISTYWLTMPCHWLWPIQLSTTAAVLSACSSGNRRYCKEDLLETCASMCLGLWLQACNKCQLIGWVIADSCSVMANIVYKCWG